MAMERIQRSIHDVLDLRRAKASSRFGVGGPYPTPSNLLKNPQKMKDIFWGEGGGVLKQLVVTTFHRTFSNMLKNPPPPENK